MAGDDGFLNGYGYVEVRLPNGDILPVEPLGVKTTVRFLRLVKEAGNGDDEALLRLCEELPAAINPPTARERIEQLMPMEIMDLAVNFFYAGRAGAKTSVGLKPPENPKTPPSSPTPEPPASLPAPSQPAASPAGTTS